MHSIFVSSATQQALQICVDEDVTQESNWKIIPKEVLLNDIQTNGQASNFIEFQQQIQVCQTEIMDWYFIEHFLELSGKRNRTGVRLWLFLFTEFLYVNILWIDFYMFNHTFLVICFDPKLKKLIENVSNKYVRKASNVVDWFKSSSHQRHCRFRSPMKSNNMYHLYRKHGSHWVVKSKSIMNVWL